MASSAWGIDVSKASVKAVRIEKLKDGVLLTNAEVVKYNPAEIVEEQIRTALKHLKNNHHIRDKVVISLPTHNGFNRLVKIPPVEESRLSEVIKYEAQNSIPFDLSQVCWGHVLLENGAVSSEREVIFVAIKQEIVEEFLSNIEPIGLKIDAVQLSPIALFAFISFDDQRKISRVILDFGAENTSLIVSEDSKFWIRNIPVTGNDITKAIATKFNLSLQKAEQIKVNAEKHPQLDKIYQAMLPVYRDLVNEIHRSLGHYRSSISKQAKFEELLILGNGAKCVNLERFLNQSLQIPTRKLTKISRIELSEDIEVDAFVKNIGTLATAIGLAIQGLGETKCHVNLLPSSVAERKAKMKKYPLLVGCFVFIYLLIGFMYFSAVSELDKWKRLEKDYKSFERRVSANKSLLGIKETSPENIEKEIERSFDPIKNAIEKVNRLNVDPNVFLDKLKSIYAPLPDPANEIIEDKDKIWLLKNNSEVVTISIDATITNLVKDGENIKGIKCSVNDLSELIPGDMMKFKSGPLLGQSIKILSITDGTIVFETPFSPADASPEMGNRFVLDKKILKFNLELAITHYEVKKVYERKPENKERGIVDAQNFIRDNYINKLEPKPKSSPPEIQGPIDILVSSDQQDKTISQEGMFYRCHVNLEFDLK